MNSSVIFIYHKDCPDSLWCYVIDENVETWLPREKGDGWTVEGQIMLRFEAQRRFLEHWDGTRTTRRVARPA